MNLFLYMNIRRYFVFFIISAICSVAVNVAYGVKPMKHLKVLATSEGAVVFAIPSKMPCVSGGKTPLEYDLTMSTLTDSVSFTCTITGDLTLPVDKICFTNLKAQSGESSFCCETEKIFKEPKDDKWVHRLRAQLSEDEFKKITESVTSPKIVIGTCTFELKPSQWKDRRIIYQTAAEIVKQNKK